MKNFTASIQRLREALQSNENKIDNWMKFTESRRKLPNFIVIYDEMIALRHQYLDAISILEREEKQYETLNDENKIEMLSQITRNAAEILYMAFILCELKKHIYLTCDFGENRFKLTFEPIEK